MVRENSTILLRLVVQRLERARFVSRCCIVINLVDSFNIINYEKDVFKTKDVYRTS